MLKTGLLALLQKLSMLHLVFECHLKIKPDTYNIIAISEYPFTEMKTMAVFTSVLSFKICTLFMLICDF